MSDATHAMIESAVGAVVSRGQSAAQWADALDPWLWSTGITTPKRIAAFVGQVAVESAGFAELEEDLHYSAGRLCAVWPSRFDPAEAARCAGNPEAVANVVYANRMGNAGPDSGDGWRFRGSGLLQLTGRAAHTAFAAAARMDLAAVGTYMRTPRGAAQSAVWFWSAHDFNAMADAWLISRISVAINGGTEGMDHRLSLTLAARKAIGNG